MKYIFGKSYWKNFDIAEQDCFLLTNGLGGFCSMSVIGSLARGDHALLMGANPAPNSRIHMVSNVCEEVIINQQKYDLTSQRYVADAKNRCGYHYLDAFSYEYVPEWHYRVDGLEIYKSILMPYEKNMVIVYYEFKKYMPENAHICVTPMLRRLPKTQEPVRGQLPEAGQYPLFTQTNGEFKIVPVSWSDTLYFSKDACDGRNADGVCFSDQQIDMDITEDVQRLYIAFSMTDDVADLDEAKAWQMKVAEVARLKGLEDNSGRRLPAAKTLARQSKAYVVQRDSTNEKSVIAGYPFFGDWGRDTMIALPGCTLDAGRYDEAKSILKSFMRYEYKGLMPNLFPEGESEPLYNTADASLLFINAVYLYYQKTKDKAFVKEALPVIEDIIKWYMKGTDYNIHMDEDGLIVAGADLWQVTWMDVRFEDILPTPRHGKPVEINAYWYNALNIVSDLAEAVNVSVAREKYRALAVKVKDSFIKAFWDESRGCLRDVISGTDADAQMRCNQIWALSLPFVIPDEAMARQILQGVYRELYTPWGLRSLSLNDAQFHPLYGGIQFKRDMAYHQGTVWAFPLGAFYKAWIRFAKNQQAAARQVLGWLEVIEAAMGEGCLGHIAEIYDGLEPNESRGCFAQAWSVGEILSAYACVEEYLQ